jgi:hypothetical protein
MSAAHAFSTGSPICEVNTLPLIEMSPSLSNPAPQGWSLRTERAFYLPGQTLTIRVAHPNAGKRARGILIWSKSGPTTGAGRFLLTGGPLYQYLPGSSNCGEWSVTHINAEAKTLDQLSFLWEAPPEGSVLLRAFLIEDCMDPLGCRAYQALTPPLVLTPALFFDGFE